MRVVKATEKYEQCNVSEGDYVLWSRVDERYHPKMLATWTAPYRAKEVVKLYAEDSFEVTDEILEHVSEKEIMLKVKSIGGHKFVPDVKDFMLEVLWEGFEDIESSWEPLQKLMHECPTVVKNYVEGMKTASEELARPKCVLRDMAWRGVVVGDFIQVPP
ncbi:hypothetical protein AaE_000878 [Aphanomyces astaci]|uniref:Chromo domain-containing protein n=1 Tax=Aphanomyces astaci TaxID=112090 RepID=A0A6A5AJQ3_APHAT|nr:hypothetical protein AaE_000878 [Aphanomyces astaci]